MNIEKIRRIIIEEMENLLIENEHNEKNTYIVDMGWKPGFVVKSSDGKSFKMNKYSVWSTINNYKPGVPQVIDSSDDLNRLKKKYNTSKVVKIKVPGLEGIHEADGDVAKQKTEKDKLKLAKQKQDLAQQKFDFQKKQTDVADRQADQRDAAAKEKEDKGTEQGGEGQQTQPETKPNISFKDQGQFYEETYPELRNFVLSDGNLLDEDERRYIALAVQAAEGRFDNGFEKFLRKGKAGNIYGKDFSNEDINKIVDYCKEHELVR